MTRNVADLEQLKKHLKRHGLWAKKSLGQHFLIDEGILMNIVNAGEIKKDETIIEVGPGPGALSQRLVEKTDHLLAVEIDQDYIHPWKDLLSDFPQAEIIHQDVLEFTPPDVSYKVIANIPYYITSPIIKHFLRHQGVRRPELIVLLIQKEVAQRICDPKKPSLLSWEIGVFGSAEIVCSVPPKSFLPPPKVDSAVLKISLYPEPLINESQFENFFSLLFVSYKQPRKTLLNNLFGSSRWPKEYIQKALDSCELSASIRPHQLSLDDWKKLLSFLNA